MRVTIHQPEHLPWLGFFHKMAQCDRYVILDNVQFTKNNFQNRNRLIDRKGNIFWSTVPVVMAGHLNKTISEIQIENRQPWARKVWARISNEYCRHPYFELYSEDIRKIFGTNYSRLVDLNIALIDFFRAQLDINVPLVRSSALDTHGVRSELLLSICNKLGASEYLSGPSGRGYLDTSLFDDANVKIAYHSFEHPSYDAPIFAPYLSTLDLLFNHGPESRRILGLSR